MDSIIGVIIFIAVLFLFTLFMQFMSKISGRNIRQKGRSTPSYTPEDFDNTMDFIKEKTDSIGTTIKKIGKSPYDQLFIDLDKVLTEPEFKFSNYLNKRQELERLTKQLEDRENKQREIEIRRQKGELLLYDDKIDGTFINTQYNIKINSLRYEISELQSFSESDLKRIIIFFDDYLKSHQEFLNFFESIGCENISGLAAEINKMEDMFLKNKLSNTEVNKIKLYILKKKGFIDNFSL